MVQHGSKRKQKTGLNNYAFTLKLSYACKAVETGGCSALNLSNCNVGPTELKEFARAVGGWQRAKQKASAEKQSKKGVCMGICFEMLDLSSNSLYGIHASLGGAYDRTGLLALVLAIKPAPMRITSLNVAHNALTGEGVQLLLGILGETIGVNVSLHPVLTGWWASLWLHLFLDLDTLCLHDLNLADNTVLASDGPKIAHATATAITRASSGSKQSLKALTLARNNLCGQHSAAIGSHHAHHTYHTPSPQEENSPTYDTSGLSHLFDAFTQHLPTLSRLDIAHNHLGHHGCMCLAAAVRGGAFVHLEQLNLRHTGLGEPGAGLTDDSVDARRPLGFIAFCQAMAGSLACGGAGAGAGAGAGRAGAGGGRGAGGTRVGGGEVRAARKGGEGSAKGGVGRRGRGGTTTANTSTMATNANTRNTSAAVRPVHPVHPARCTSPLLHPARCTSPLLHPARCTSPLLHPARCTSPLPQLQLLDLSANQLCPCSSVNPQEGVPAWVVHNPEAMVVDNIGTSSGAASGTGSGTASGTVSGGGSRAAYWVVANGACLEALTTALCGNASGGDSGGDALAAPTKSSSHLGSRKITSPASHTASLLPGLPRLERIELADNYIPPSVAIKYVQEMRRQKCALPPAISAAVMLALDQRGVARSAVAPLVFSFLRCHRIVTT
jgi:hypothetical protein